MALHVIRLKGTHSYHTRSANCLNLTCIRQGNFILVEAITQHSFHIHQVNHKKPTVYRMESGPTNFRRHRSHNFSFLDPTLCNKLYQWNKYALSTSSILSLSLQITMQFPPHKGKKQQILARRGIFLAHTNPTKDHPFLYKTPSFPSRYKGKAS